MSKELEAWGRIKEFDSGGEFVSLYDFHEEDIEIIDKALTPPTADEVCKALSERLNEEVVIDKIFNNTMFKTKRGNNIAYMTIHNIQISQGLPPHLLKMIAQFYEGERK